MTEIAGVRLNWDYKIQSPDEKELYVTAKVTLVAIDRDKGEIMRQLPSDVKEVFVKLVNPDR
jgi:acyl-CoA thioester hydrolase